MSAKQPVGYLEVLRQVAVVDLNEGFFSQDRTGGFLAVAGLLGLLTPLVEHKTHSNVKRTETLILFTSVNIYNPSKKIIK